MVVVGEGADGVVADLVGVPDGGGQGEQALADAGAQAGQGAGAVAFQAEFVFGGPDDGFEPLADAAEGAVAVGLVAPVGAGEGAAEGEAGGFEVRARGTPV